MKFKKAACGILAGAFILLSGCGTEPQPETAPSEPAPVPVTEARPIPTEPETAPPSAAEALLHSMTLRQKIGQLFIVRPDALDFSQSPAQNEDPNSPGVLSLTEEIKNAMTRYPVGGFVLFGKNIQTPQQTSDLLRELQESAAVPLFLAVDEEGGPVARLAGNPAFGLPQYANAAAVGATGNPQKGRDMGETIGQYLSRIGFNMNFAPVADVNTNPDNPVIGRRAFSSDPTLAAAFVRSVADGLEQNGIIPVFKHFPGHGDTREDSHHDLAVTRKTAEEMRACEWLPFREATDGECIMVGHIAAPELTDSMTPASMSPDLISQYLRGELGFDGLIITDALSMDAITDSYTDEGAGLLALRAGCDLLLIPRDFRAAFDGILHAVEDGSYPQEELDRVVLRILNFKDEKGLLPQ